MKILFFLTGTIWRYTFPEGFIDAGHEVEITDTIDEDKIKIKINNFNPRLLTKCQQSLILYKYVI